MDEMLASASQEVLAEMVKLSQKLGMSGSQGHWKKFLASHDKQLGTSLCDPSKRSVETLVAFLKTFTSEEDLKYFKNVLDCHAIKNEVDQVNKTSPDDETAEQRLVRLTLDHPLYPLDYKFPVHEEDWVSAKPSAKKSTQIIAIDCEMVLCEDGTEALVKVCAVDRDMKILLHEVVNPNKAIADYRTEITGISAKEIEGVTCSLKDVQKSLKKLLGKGKILAGHSLNNDLSALKLNHGKVIDTSYIFKYPNSPINRRPSLSYLCQAMLGYELRRSGSAHNCEDDARAAMNLILARLEGRIGDVLPQEVKDLDTPKLQMDVAKLLVHRIPYSIPCIDLLSVLAGDCTIEQKPRKKNSPTYSAFAIFQSQQEADEAFDNLKGDLLKDTVGRSQKLVKFELESGKSGTICVCKTSNDNAAVQQTSNKRPAEDEDNSSALKKSKTDRTCEQPLVSETPLSECEMHMKEIERLKKLVVHRDEEISSLNKIIVALARKQVL